jgi:putative ABC transport system permease protein
MAEYLPEGSMLQDVRYAIRSLASTPVLTLTALLVLSLGIGATTAIFSVANAVLLRQLPFADPGRLVQFGAMSIQEFQAYRERSRSFDGLVSYQAINRNLNGVAEPERVAAIASERGLFELLGVSPLAGRTFTQTDAPNVAVVSEGFWRRRFAAKTTLDNSKIVLDGEAYTVVGIMPAIFQFPYRSVPTDIWIPTDLPRTESRFQRIDVAVGRLKIGVPIEAAAAELRAIAQQLEPLARPGTERTTPMVPLREAVVEHSRMGILILLGAVVMVLLIACANVSSLMLARANARRREVAVRTALGASRSRILRQFLCESTLLALTASGAGLVISVAGTKLFVSLAGAGIPRATEVGLDWRTLVFLLALSAIASTVLGLLPAVDTIRADVSGLLSESGSRGSRGRKAALMNNALVVTEIALAFILLTGAGLLLRAFFYLEHTTTGIAGDRVLTLRLETRGLVPSQPSPTEGGTGMSAQGRYFREIEERVMQIPGVRSAGFVTRLHLQNPGNAGEFTIVGRPLPPNGRGAPVRLREASPGYFRALGIPLRAGRFLTAGDAGILVNEALVRQHLAGEDPIGRVLSRGTIVGVVGDVRQSLRLPAEPEIYKPLEQTSYSAATLVVSAETSPRTLIGPIRAALLELNPNQAAFDVQMMDDVIDVAHGDVDRSLWLIGLFAGLAFVLSVAGIYGVSAQAASARLKEFGIRVALGADRPRLIRYVLAQGGRLIVVGVLAGLAGALGLTRLLQSLLYVVTPTDPITFLSATLLLSGVAVTAYLNPARQATNVDPISVLRHE